VLLAGFYWTIDVLKRGRWAYALVVIGANSIAAYVIAHLWDTFIQKNLVTHFGAGVFKMFGAAYQPLVLGGATLAILWLVLWWMYRRKVFLKI
jgi:heparan-alpha-glucosaminide N-acetyltransferase